ncbi:MAG: hypothetical protein LQ350_002338 [Teloschistes chrysophthalmus]|nr:MAG: hypothetical protein LQ350_002338 [Niorma chrysophthalma]
MPLIRKRRAQAEASPSPPAERRRQSPPASDVSSADEAYGDGAAADGDTQGAGSNDQMVKKLVRLALASEYSRQPIRRADITAKVMAPNTGRQFKTVFEQANHQLRSTFGCEMTELPQKEKVTISQKRAAQRNATQNSLTTSKSYILTSTLAAPLRTPSILPPSAAPTAAAESAYIGLYTFVLSIIYLSPGHTIPESRLEKHLKRMNADNYVLGGEKTERVLKRMEKEGYIVKVKERDGGGEESVEIMVGPRGKAEVGERGVAGVVRKVWGVKGAQREEVEKRLVRSLGEGVEVKYRGGNEGEGEAQEDGAEEGEEDGEGVEDGEGEGGRRRSSRGKKATPAGRSGRGRGRKSLVDEEADGEDDEDEEAEEGESEEDE